VDLSYWSVTASEREQFADMHGEAPPAMQRSLSGHAPARFLFLRDVEPVFDLAHLLLKSFIERVFVVSHWLSPCPPNLSAARLRRYPTLAGAMPKDVTVQRV
jgi:hypothetical protein